MTYQPEKYTRRWFDTVDRERGEIVDILAETPGLRPSRDGVFAKAYVLARKDGARETGLALAMFPEIPPFSRGAAEDSEVLQRNLGAGASRG